MSASLVAGGLLAALTLDAAAWVCLPTPWAAVSTLILLFASAVLVGFSFSDDAPTEPEMVLLAALAAGAAFLIMASGPQLHHRVFGERVVAQVTGIDHYENEDNEPTGIRSYQIREHATGEDLGSMHRGPKEAIARGELLEVSVDRLGLAAPVAAQRLGHTVLPGSLLVLCLAAMAVVAAHAARAERRWERARWRPGRRF